MSNTPSWDLQPEDGDVEVRDLKPIGAEGKYLDMTYVRAADVLLQWYARGCTRYGRAEMAAREIINPKSFEEEITERKRENCVLVVSPEDRETLVLALRDYQDAIGESINDLMNRKQPADVFYEPFFRAQRLIDQL